MRSFAFVFCLLASTISFAQSNSEKRLIGVWKYDAKSVQIVLNAQGQAQLAKAGPNGQQHLNAMKAGFGRMMGNATFKFESNHRFEFSLNNPATHGKEKETGKWVFKSGHVLVTPDNGRPSLDFLANKDLSRLVNIYKRPSFGEGRITAVKISKGYRGQ